MKMAILIACYNRAEITLRSLEGLSKVAKEVDYDVFLVDDASPDGTGAMVRARFPDVHVIDGTGRLYWAKGMRLAWDVAARCADYDFYLWLNDDVILKPDAVANILADYMSLTTNHETPIHNSEPVIVGACAEDTTESTCSYGATDCSDRKITPNGVPQRADGWLNGNFVLVPKEVYRRIGMISGEYSHARADYDYAERLKVANIAFYSSSTYVGVCHNNFSEKMRLLTLLQRIKLLWRPGYWNLHDLWLIRSRYHGARKAVLSCVHLILIALKGVK